MHSPSTVAFEIRSPFRDKPSNMWPKGYRQSLFTIWHNDPEKDGSDDSCGWFIQPRHSDKRILDAISKRFGRDWDQTFTHDGRTYHTGLFAPDGYPIMSTGGIMLNLFQAAAWEHYYHKGGESTHRAWKGSKRFCQRHLAEILMFAENPVDSMRNSIHQVFGVDKSREERIRHFAGVIYSYILRLERPWYKHPRWHVYHWSVQWHFVQRLRRKLFDRCKHCGNGFAWREAPTTDSWNKRKHHWWQSDPDVYHCRCGRCVSAAQGAEGGSSEGKPNAVSPEHSGPNEERETPNPTR